MNAHLIDGIEAVAFFGAGTVFGLVIAAVLSYLEARADLARSVVTVADAEKPTKRTRLAWLNNDKLWPFIVVLVMVALLLAGLSWIKVGQENAADARRDCRRTAQMAETLQGRTDNYKEAARAERRLWNDLQTYIDRAAPDSPLLRSIDRYRERQEEYLAHLRENPYPKADEC